jgi:hypothetical protein
MHSLKLFLTIFAVISFSTTVFTFENSLTTGNNPSEKISIEQYFPLDENLVLQYNSNFGPTNYTTKKSGGGYVQEYKSDEFFSAQNIKIIDNSVFITKMEQEVDVLMFISHNITVTYSEPALLLPLSVTLNEEWSWKGIEYVDEHIDTITITGKLTGFEEIVCEAGTFNCLRFDYKISKASGKVTNFTEWREKDIGIVKLVADVSQKGFAGMMISLLGYDDIYFELEKVNIL